ncbi:MAG: metalloprotease family protein [Kiritimatiellaeota bacterium]|nr:metalloprotease family protein [Kiritimatiellota bacterium]
MIMIPGVLIAIVTFPGVIVHEAAHLLFCKWRKVPVMDACFFRVGDPLGYVIHGGTDNFTTAFLISIGPFIINSLLCIFICLPAYAPVRVFGLSHPLSYVLLWLGVSIGMHAFPSMQDASNLWQAAKVAARRGNLLAIVSFPLVILIYLANCGRFFWFDYGYGLMLGWGLPWLLFKL